MTRTEIENTFMRENSDWFLMLVMAAYVLFRGFTTFAIGPIAGLFFYGHEAAYFVSLLTLAALAVLFGFTRRQSLSCSLALMVGLVSVCYWWFEMSRGARPVWDDLGALVIPEMVFSIAGIARWLLRRAETPHLQSDGNRGA